MPLNSFNVGKDVSLDIITQLGTFSFQIPTGFEARPIYAKRQSHGLDGINRFIPLPAGWEGSLELDRGDNNADSFFATTEALYYAGSPILSATITETISNPDLSVSQYLFTGVVLMLREGGRWRGDDIVKMTIDFEASQRLEIA